MYCLFCANATTKLRTIALKKPINTIEAPGTRLRDSRSLIKCPKSYTYVRNRIVA